MFTDLLEPDYGEDQSPPDDTRITQVILYFNEPDVAELKRLAKEAMKIEMPNDYIENGNLSNLYLLLLKKYYGNSEIKGISIRQGSEQIAGNVLGGGFV